MSQATSAGIPGLGRGANRFLNRLLWIGRNEGGIQRTQEQLGKALALKRDSKSGKMAARNVTTRMVRRYLRELAGLVQVEQGGDGQPAVYYFTDMLSAELGAGLARGCFGEKVPGWFQAGSGLKFRAEISDAPLQVPQNTPVAGKKFRAENPLVINTCSSCCSESPALQHYSPLVNNAAGEKPSPKAQRQEPDAGNSSGLVSETDVARIREALKARPEVRVTPAFDPVIREMLATGETVETIERAIVRGCWLKLSCHDRGDTAPIFSMRYFAGVLTDVKAMTDAVYWRNLAARLAREERKRGLGDVASSGGRQARIPVAAPCPPEARGAA